jgi:hypothetical protein
MKPFLPLLSTLLLASLAALHADDRVVFWGHMMPVIPNGNIHAHFEGNNEAWPFSSQSTSTLEEFKEHIRMALDSGLDGFQMMAFPDSKMFEAARLIREETGQMFYVAPQWDGFGDDPVKAADTVAKFTERFKGNPHVFQHEGRPVHFTYYSGKWEKNPDAVRAFNEGLKARNVNTLLAPTITEATILDLPALGRRVWSKPFEPGPLQWLKMGFEAATTFEMDARTPVAAAIDKRLRQDAPGFFFVPSLGAGYDSSNRPSQAIRVPFNGVRTVLDSFDTWTKLGYRQISFVTWNDCNETQLVPSSRNVWGYNTIIKYLREHTATGKSPFAAPQAIVAYPVECIFGDRLNFQVLGLPAAGQGLVLRVKVVLTPVGGGDPIHLESETAACPADGRTLTEMNWESGSAIGKFDAVQPRVTVSVRAADTDEWRVLHDNLLLPPVRLSANLVRFPNGYAINLSKVSPDGSLGLAVSSDSIARVTVDAKAGSPIRRLHLQDGTRSLGVFRDAEKPSPGLLRNLFIRLQTSAAIPMELSIAGGRVIDFYTPAAWPEIGVTEAGPAPGRFSSFAAHNAWYGGKGTRLIRIDAPRDAAIRLIPAGNADAAIETTLADLRSGRLTRSIQHEGKPVTVSLILCHDGTDPNLDFPLPATGVFTRDVPLFPEPEGLRVVSAAALLESGQMVYSPAVVVESPAGKKVAALPWIETQGSFDDFVLSGSMWSANPFTASQVKQTQLPRNRLPYFHLGFEEGAGARLNDYGIDHQSGRAWIGDGPRVHRAGYAADGFEWLREGGHLGGALRLSAKTSIQLRSKSAPLGPRTLSFWVKMGKPAGETPGWKSLRADPFLLELRQDSEMHLAFELAGTKAELLGKAPLHEGWNHLAFVYDLAAISLWHDGKLISTRPDVPPAYQRTHVANDIAFRQPDSQGLRFTGEIDEVEVIGTALGQDDITQLFQGIPWIEKEALPR